MLRVSALQELRLTPHIAAHDLDIKARQAAKFLAHGERVRATVLLRDRLVARQEAAVALLDRFCGQVGPCRRDGAAVSEGRRVSLLWSPTTRTDAARSGPGG